MSNTENLGLKIPTLAEKNIHTTYVDNNDIIDEAYGQYLEDKETAQENIAMIESSTAQSNHTAGSYFMLDNVLHKATSAIASGESIVSGSNATPITIEQALTALNSSIEVDDRLVLTGHVNERSTPYIVLGLREKDNNPAKLYLSVNDGKARIDHTTDGSTWQSILVNDGALERVTEGDIGWTQISTLSTPTQLTHPGLYHIDTCNNICREFTDYSTGDFMGFLMSNNYYSNNGGCRYGTLIMTSPRWAQRFWIIRIWDGSFTKAKMIGA